MNRAPSIPVGPGDIRRRSAPRIPAIGPSSSDMARPAGRSCGCSATTVSSRPWSSSTWTPCASLRQDGIDAVYGDATRPETLEAAGVARAGSLILASAGMANSAEVIRNARGLNPHVRVLARAPYLRDLASLKEAGANSVYSGEGEVALAFIEDILEDLGATPEQIDRERARAHRELSGDAAPASASSPNA